MAHFWAIERDGDGFELACAPTRKQLTALLADGFVRRCGFLGPRDTCAIVKVEIVKVECNGCDGCDEDWAIEHSECSVCGKPISNWCKG